MQTKLERNSKSCEQQSDFFLYFSVYSVPLWLRANLFPRPGVKEE